MTTGSKAYALRLPADLHQRLHALALVERRSLNSQIVVLLEDALAVPRSPDPPPRSELGPVARVMAARR